ncbi:MAG: right-handed parallel beta-helix repeat-containing protein [bacterium]
MPDCLAKLLQHSGLLLLATLLAACAAAGADSGTPAPQPDNTAAGLPEPARLLELEQGPADPARELSYINVQGLRGEQFTLASPGVLVGAGVALQPASGSGAIEWAVYSLPIQGLATDSLIVRASLAPGAGGESRGTLLLADFASGRWRVTGEAGAGASLLPVGNIAASPQGRLWAAVVVSEPSGLLVEELGASSAWDSPVPDYTVAQALHVGPGQAYADIESAYTAAADNTMIVVHPQPGNAPYGSPALQVHKPGIQFVADNGTLPAGQRVRLQGGSYNYTGAGSTPRAIFQFNPGSDGGLVRGFELFDAHNDSNNGAGVRINQANDITVQDCEIHGCDMGIMSNGDAVSLTGARQLIDSCLIHGNGDFDHPGFNHNLYLGGHSAVLRFCEVHGALTGHNVKSRAHTNALLYCHIHDSANREIDFVDSADTELPGSDSLLLGCVIVKAVPMDGNKHTIHFGQDGGNDHTGVLRVVNCTVVSPYLTPLVQLTAAGAGLELRSSLLWGTEAPASAQSLVTFSGGASAASVSGSHNWFSEKFSLPEGSALELASCHIAAAGLHPPFADAALQDYRLTGPLANLTDSAWDTAPDSFPLWSVDTAQSVPQFEYAGVGEGRRRLMQGAGSDIGAFEWVE